MSNARELAELGGSYGTGGFVGMKNRIINGAMMIDQRNAGASVTPTNTSVPTYTLDRWFSGISAASKFSVQRNGGSVTPPNGFINYLGVTSLSAYSVGSSDYFTVTQIIEGFNISDFGWGTASAAPIAVSFWVRSSLTGTFGGSVSNGSYARTYPFTYTINSANTWEQKTVTIAGDTTGTWATDNSVGLVLKFSLGAGTTYSGTGGAWAAANYVSATGATSVVGTSGATFYITGVQLEKGSTATSFDYRPYGTELALCQRYFYLGGTLFQGANSAAGVFGGLYPFPCPMRTAPSVSQSGTITIYGPNFADYNASSPSVSAYAPYSFGRVSFGTGSGGGAGVGTYCYGSGTLSFSAEL